MANFYQIKIDDNEVASERQIYIARERAQQIANKHNKPAILYGGREYGSEIFNPKKL